MLYNTSHIDIPGKSGSNHEQEDVPRQLYKFDKVVEFLDLTILEDPYPVSFRRPPLPAEKIVITLCDCVFEHEESNYVNCI